jgi:hypothetical protein
MRRLGKLAILTFAEYESVMCRCEDAEAHVGDFAALLHHSETMLEMERDTNRAARKRAFLAGKFHAAGGYAHALVELRRRLKETQEQVAKYKPIGEIFQPSETLTALLEDVCGVSDVDAAADFEVVGNAVATERRQS